MDARKFIVFDEDDLAVVSAHVQDADVTLSGIHWQPGDKRLVVEIARRDWETPDAGAPQERRLTALRFDRVLSCQCRDIDKSHSERTLTLVGITFVAGDAPAGIITLMFADGAALRLTVECLEAAMIDLASIATATAGPAQDRPDFRP